MHIPVLVDKVIEMLNIKRDGRYVDATVGLGGHSERILSLLSDRGMLVGIDKDEEALIHAKERLGNNRVFLKKGAFSMIDRIIREIGIEEVDGVLFDLGVSMLQLKTLERGFSFLSDEFLDMRMDLSQELTAWDVVNRYTEERLERILREYGEEPFSKKIAKEIVLRRKKSPIDTCFQLSQIVADIYKRRGRIHPATRTFQALRIEVNKELDELREGLKSSLNILKKGGRLCVISYHSLEDRIVKNFMRDKSKEGLLNILTKKPITPLQKEVKENPASRSAKLRVSERI
jgi:16S rRNA (cytosine1402-N4)-methyltransferase